MIPFHLRLLLAIALLVATACHDTVAPTTCESVTQRGWHADTTITHCR